MSPDEIERYTTLLRESSSLAELPHTFPQVVSDPEDDPILQTAIAGKADVLCSRDRVFEPEFVHQLCAAHRIRILDDIALLHELRRLAGPEIQ